KLKNGEIKDSNQLVSVEIKIKQNIYQKEATKKIADLTSQKKEINFATSQLIKFVREKLSNEYLELSKIALWDTNTKNTILFVYQQLLIMLHPAIPFITEHIYQRLTHQKILQTEIEIIDIKDQKQEL
ncbi:13459_t:CDS:2, partial [Cetraspora pellucida]